MSVSHNDNGYSVRVQVPLTTLYASSSMIGLAVPFATINRDQQGVSRYALSSIPVASSVLVGFDLPPIPYQIGNAGNNAPRGFQVTDVTAVVTVSSGATSASNGASTFGFTAWLYPSSGFTDAATATTAPAAYGGSSSQWTYNEGSSTGASMGGVIGPSTNFQVLTFVPGSGLNSVINTDNQRLAFEMYWIATASQHTFSINDLTVHGKWILGG